jgi:large subunit ribosomal protein L21
MYAVIRAGGKQYRVAPGDVIRIEKRAADNGKAGTIDFGDRDVIAVSGEEGKVAPPQGEVRVSGRILEQGRAEKILVFHYKRKKQYKKLVGHRQPFTAIRITEIAFDGKSFKAPHRPEAQPESKRRSQDVVKSAVEIAGTTAGVVAGVAGGVKEVPRPSKPAGSKKASAKGAGSKPSSKSATRKSPKKPGGGKGKK